MPSPFPGMDPYLEGELWQEFHERLASTISAQLMPRLSPGYVALLAKRYVLDHPGLAVFDTPRVIYPDVHVVAWSDTGPANVATATITLDEPAVELANAVEVPQLSIEIRDVAQRRLVTEIEILSPADKHGEGAREYRERRNNLLRTATPLIELDLLRRGDRILLDGEPPPAPYYVYLSRTQRRPFTQVWPVPMQRRLPTIPVPLLPHDPDTYLDIQAAVDACFALVGYERLIDYTAPPPVPELSPADMSWLDETLRPLRSRPT